MRAVLCGYYGKGNGGDEQLLDGEDDDLFSMENFQKRKLTTAQAQL